MAKFYV